MKLLHLRHQTSATIIVNVICKVCLPLSQVRPFPTDKTHVANVCSKCYLIQHLCVNSFYCLRSVGSLECVEYDVVLGCYMSHGCANMIQLKL